MTNKEALKAAVEGIHVSDTSIEKAFLEANINGSETYAPEKEKDIDLCAIKLLQKPIPESISEGDYSVKNSRATINAVLLYLARKHGLQSIIQELEPPKPRIGAKRNAW
jgi:hypothetical protein